MGATRGSFYWHFKDRQQLIEVALEQWERENATELIPDAEAIDDPVERLRYLFREVYERPVDAIELALATAADEPLVAPVFARVTRTRGTSYVESSPASACPMKRPTTVLGSPTASTSATISSLAMRTLSRSSRHGSTAWSTF